MPTHSIPCILALNCGSSSLKFCLYGASDLRLLRSGAITQIGGHQGQFEIFDSVHHLLSGKTSACANIHDATGEIIAYLGEHEQDFTLSAIGHRIVQGGPNHREPELITDDLLQQLEDLIYLAPNHLPGELEVIRAIQKNYPKQPQVACFDTAFHRDMPDHVKYYPLPHKFQTKGLMKYGFHGLSYQYIMQKLMETHPEAKQEKIVIAHLGNGASMAAVDNGVGVDTTMGLTPLGGLVMSTRSGDLDPGVLLFLLKEHHLTADELDKLLSNESGLKGIAGTGDVAELLKMEEHYPKAALALTVFCYQARKFIGALAAAMGGLNRLVFTGGIGANSPQIRERICSGLGFMGIAIGEKANNSDIEMISAQPGRVTVQAMQTNEELVIARLVSRVVNNITTK
ncbi:acetate/propionate family kinase [Mucilaginibacter psychrotolerans]|uniref:Acetate kinase n=1 Tax=Mucilaginibacter psychrotolerans TaxID=1524096 RepID=A0A4Y8SJ41_9SPHI|nr:acetate/propionate family kinase [Mucilaginibacter psychrotolerans]TFF38527.1 acetate/propionate family kinase [Mucilaginibacter psychrotolerans]